MSEAARPSPARARFLIYLSDHSARIAVAAAVASFLVGAAVAVSEGDALPFPDEREYYLLAGHLAHAGSFSYDGVHPTALHPPGFPVWLALLRLTGLGVVGMRIAGAALLAAAVLLLHSLLRPRLGGAVAALSCCVTALYPLLIYTSTRLYPQVLALVLILIMLLAARRALETSSWLLWGSASGLSGGALLLTVPALGLLLLLIAGVLAVISFRHYRRLLAVALLAGLLLPSVWIVRNALSLQAFVPLSTNTGQNLLLGNSEHAEATTGVSADIRRYTATAESRGFDEVAADRYYRSAAIAWVTAHPGEATALYSRKVLYNFAFANRLYVAEESSPARTLVSAVTYLPFLALFLLRLVTMMRRRPPPQAFELLLVVLVVGNAMVQAISTTRVRYRIPADPFLIALGLAQLLTWVWPPIRLRDAGNPPTVAGLPQAEQPASSVTRDGSETV